MKHKDDQIRIFKDRLDKLRDKRSNTEFSKALGMSRQTIGFYLNGDRLPDVLSLRKIAEKCDVSTDWLLGLTDVTSPDGELQQACKYIGLSENAVKKISRADYSAHEIWKDILSYIIEDDEFFTICHFLYKAFSHGVSASAFDAYYSYKYQCEDDREEAVEDKISSAWQHVETFMDAGYTVLPFADACDYYTDRACHCFSEIARRLVCNFMREDPDNSAQE